MFVVGPIVRIRSLLILRRRIKSKASDMPRQDDWGAGARTESDTRQVDPISDRRTGRSGPSPGDEPVWEHTPARDERPARERPSPELKSEAKKVTRAPSHDTEDEPRKPWYRRHPIAVALGLLCSMLALPAGYLYWDYTSHFAATDDAYIASRQFAIAPEVSGYITSVPVTDNEHVNTGDVIVRIDDRSYRAALAYLPGTLILETEFETATGRAAIVDFMPFEDGANLVRIAMGRCGYVDFRNEFIVRFNYGAIIPWASHLGDGSVDAIAGPERVVLRTAAAVHYQEAGVQGEFTVEAGECVPFVLS
jgi:hypothetical protein